MSDSSTLPPQSRAHFLIIFDSELIAEATFILGIYRKSADCRPLAGYCSLEVVL